MEDVANALINKTTMKTTIKIELNKQEYTIELNDSETAKGFVQSAPFATSLSEYAGSHYWGSIPRKLSTPKEMKTSTPRKGGIYYADHLTAVAVYFDDPGSIEPYVVYHLGDVVEDTFALRNAGRHINMKVL
jgi:hypothetical protein